MSIVFLQKHKLLKKLQQNHEIDSLCWSWHKHLLISFSTASRALVRNHRHGSCMDQLQSPWQDAAGSIQRSDVWTLQGNLRRSAGIGIGTCLFPPLHLRCLRNCQSTWISDSRLRRWFAAVSKLFPDWHGSSQHPVHGLSQSDSILDDAKQTQAQCGQDGSDVDEVREKAKEFVPSGGRVCWLCHSDFFACAKPGSHHWLGPHFLRSCYKTGQLVLLPAAADSIRQEVLDDRLCTRHRSGSHTLQTRLLQQPVVRSS